MSEAPCTRCGCLIFDAHNLENGCIHVICTGCDFEWVE